MMGIKEQVSAEQWKLIVNAPGAASTFVATASGGGFEVFKEIFTASQFTAELGSKTAGSGYGILVDDLLAAMKGMSIEDAKTFSFKYEATDLAGMRAEMKKAVADGVGVASTLPGGDGY